MSQQYGTPKLVYFNVDDMCLSDSAGVPLPAAKNTVKLTLFCKYVLKVTFLNSDGTAAIEWQGQEAFWGAVDNNFDRTEAGFVTVAPTAFNVTGDWTVDSISDGYVDVFSPEDGKLCARLDLDSDALATEIGTDAEAAFDFEIHGRRPNETRSTCIMRIPLSIRNVRDVSDDPYATPTPTPTPTPTLA